MSIDLSAFVALIRLALWATHLYVPISVFLTLLRDNVCFSCPIPLIFRLSLYQITFAGGFPPLPLHAHLILSPSFTMAGLEQLTVTVGFTEI